MSKFKRALIGAVTIWPMVYVALFFSFVLSNIFSVFHSSGTNVPFTGLIPILILHFLTMILVVALMVGYVIHVFKNTRLTESKKTLWVIVLIFGNAIAMPIYWYLSIWTVPSDKQ